MVSRACALVLSQHLCVFAAYELNSALTFIDSPISWIPFWNALATPASCWSSAARRIEVWSGQTPVKGEAIAPARSAPPRPAPPRPAGLILMLRCTSQRSLRCIHCTPLINKQQQQQTNFETYSFCSVPRSQGTGTTCLCSRVGLP